MGIFEYLGVLISVIMGLGITHPAIGASKLVQHRDQCNPIWRTACGRLAY